MIKQPRILNFSKLGESSLGYISVSENCVDIPFEVKRVFWAYYTPHSVIRGNHAHHNTEMVLLAVAGNIQVDTETIDGNKETYFLNQPDYGLFLPKLCWHTMKYSHNAVQLVLASELYNENDYIRDYTEFNKLKNGI
jgi:hypothetical protein